MCPTQSVCTKSPRKKPHDTKNSIRASAEDIREMKPLGENESNVRANCYDQYSEEMEFESTLQRSQSLAMDKRLFFNEKLHCNKSKMFKPPNQRSRRRSQLIPRAKLISNYQRNRRQSHECINLLTFATNFELTQGSLQSIEIQSSPQDSNCELPTRTTKNKKRESNNIVHKNCEVLANSRNEYESTSRLHTSPNVDNQTSYTIDKLGGQENFIGDSTAVGMHNNSTDVDNEKINEICLPNYYPDSRYDTDVSLTDNGSTLNSELLNNNSNHLLFHTSLANSANDRLSSNHIVHSHSENANKYVHDDNIIFGINSTYSQKSSRFNIADNNYAKQKTIRGDNLNKIQSFDNCFNKQRYSTTAALNKDSDEESMSDLNPHYYELQFNKEDLHPTINRNGNDCEFNVEDNPIYDEIPFEPMPNISLATITFDKKTSPLQVAEEETCKHNMFGEDIQIKQHSQIKTYVHVEGIQDIVEQDYKTIVSIPEIHSGTKSYLKKVCATEDSEKEIKKHSHNYLKEFLETQKGSKGPLQNFISKKVSRAFSHDDNVEALKTTMKDLHLNVSSSVTTDNQYHSLPDIAISRSLQKYDKIDKKLRKYETKHLKTKADAINKTSRFIVNIGNHFGVQAQRIEKIPIDFELKISKIQKADSGKEKLKSQDYQSPQLNDTINNQTISNGLHKRPPEFQANIKNAKDNEIESITDGHKAKCALHQNIDVDYESFTKDCENEEFITTNLEFKLATSQTLCDQHYKKELKLNAYGKKSLEIQQLTSNVNELTEDTNVNTRLSLVDENVLVNNVTENSTLENNYRHYNKNSAALISNGELEDINAEPEPHGMTFIDGSNGMKDKIKDNGILCEDNLAIHNEDRETDISKVSTGCRKQEFDHIRYRVLKSNLLQKKILSNYKENQFHGLMQYLQDFSCHELLIDNNIVIIEPIRTNIFYKGSDKQKSNPEIHKSKVTDIFTRKQSSDEASLGAKRHFFYHPIRVNREVNDDELPNPDTVNKVRQMFEEAFTEAENKTSKIKPKRSTEILKDSSGSVPTGEHKNDFQCTHITSPLKKNKYIQFPIEQPCCENVSEDILERIRERGTTITYYGGHVLDNKLEKSEVMTKEIMEEIRGNQKYDKQRIHKHISNKTPICQAIEINESTQNNGAPQKRHDLVSNIERRSYSQISFKLVKSNSCNSRLELLGSARSVNHINHDSNEHIIHHVGTKLNESLNSEMVGQNVLPKIIGAETKRCQKKMMQWGDQLSEDKSDCSIYFTKKHAFKQDFNESESSLNCTSTHAGSKSDMEFESYEVA